jgi:hypothetical protein
MATKTIVSASASVNPLVPLNVKKSGILQFAITSSALKLNYTEYKKMDQKLGATHEIEKAHRVGKQLNAAVRYRAVSTSGTYYMRSPLTDYEAITDAIESEDGISSDIEFMPMLLVKSDDYPDGILNEPDTNQDKKDAVRLAKAMNTDLKDLTKALVEIPKIPPVGSTEWAKYSKQNRQSGEGKSDTTYRRELVENTKERKKQQDDITDISIGYYGTFNPEATVMPEALYYTFLTCLEHTSYNEVKTYDYSANETEIGKSRVFAIHGHLYGSLYTLNGYIHREVTGVVKGNSKKHLGFAKVSVHLNDEDPLDIAKGIVLHSDYSEDNLPYYDKGTWYDANDTNSSSIPDMYVSIKVQITPTTYRELILVDLYQETVIEGKGRTRISNSGNQSRNEKNLTWKEAYIAESFIPLTKESMLKVRLIRRQNLLIECKSHFTQVMNIQTVKLKWYQTGIFRAIVAITSIFITIISGGSLAGALVNLAIGMAVSFAVTAVVKVLVSIGILKGRWVIAILATVAAGVSYYAGVPIDLTDITTVIQLTEATGKVYTELAIQATKEYQQKVGKLREEQKALEETSNAYESMHLSSSIGQLSADLQRMLDAVTSPIMETRDEFLDRTLSTVAVTQELSGTALVANLYIDKG